MSNSIRVVSHISEVRGELEEACTKALEAIGLAAEGNAKVEITNQKAVDTGALRNSLTHEVDGRDVYIGTNIKYAPYVELGTGTLAVTGGRMTPWRYQDADGNWYQTSGMRPRPYLKPAVTKGAYVKQYAQILKNEFEN